MASTTLEQSQTSADPQPRQAYLLAAKAVQGAALALERADDVHGGDGLLAGMLRLGDSVEELLPPNVQNNQFNVYLHPKINQNTGTGGLHLCSLNTHMRTKFSVSYLIHQSGKIKLII
jgi:hypothetical protein